MQSTYSFYDAFVFVLKESFPQSQHRLKKIFVYSTNKLQNIMTRGTEAFVQRRDLWIKRQSTKNKRHADYSRVSRVIDFPLKTHKSV